MKILKLLNNLPQLKDIKPVESVSINVSVNPNDFNFKYNRLGNTTKCRIMLEGEDVTIWVFTNDEEFSFHCEAKVNGLRVLRTLHSYHKEECSAHEFNPVEDLVKYTKDL